MVKINKNMLIFFLAFGEKNNKKKRIVEIYQNRINFFYKKL